MADKMNFDGDAELAAFELMLDTFGGDAARWPADRAAGADVLLRRPDASGAAARRSLAAARALDRALAVAPELDIRRVAALTARIISQARAPEIASNVVPLTAARRSRKTIAATMPATRRSWVTAAMLAASLLVGIAIGPGSTGLPALHAAADAIGLGGYVDQLALAPNDDLGSPEEDVL